MNEPIYCIFKKEKGLHLQRTVFNRYGSGLECLYVQLTKNCGIKVFPGLRDCKVSFRKQKLAARHKLAPKVFSKAIKKINVKNFKYYGCPTKTFINNVGYFYETEVASNVGEGVNLKKGVALEKALKRIGISTGDLYENNMGRVRGKLVCIDFGLISTT